MTYQRDFTVIPIPPIPPILYSVINQTDTQLCVGKNISPIFHPYPTHISPMIFDRPRSFWFYIKRPFVDEHHFIWWRDVMAWEQPCGGCTMNTGDGERAKSVAHCSGCTVMAMDCRLVSAPVRWLLIACSLLVHWRADA